MTARENQRQSQARLLRWLILNVWLFTEIPLGSPIEEYLVDVRDQLTTIGSSLVTETEEDRVSRKSTGTGRRRARGTIPQDFGVSGGS